MKGTAPVSSRNWIVPIAAISQSIARIENMTAGEAIVWLTGLVPGNEILQRLVNLPSGTGAEHGHPTAVSPDESLRVWKAMSRRAASRSNTGDDLPPSAQSWGLLADDLLKLDGDGFTAALIKELQSLAVSAKPSLLVPERSRPCTEAAARDFQEVDPSELPDELDIANQAHRAVTNGYGDPNATFRTRLVAWIVKHRPDVKPEARERIATVANADKATGRRRHGSI